MQGEKDDKLWQIAKRRADFKYSLFAYFVITAICWAIWYFTDGFSNGIAGTPWPLWVMLGLGLSLMLKFVKAYRDDKDTVAEQEYKKLKDQSN